MKPLAKLEATTSQEQKKGNGPITWFDTKDVSNSPKKTDNKIHSGIKSITKTDHEKVIDIAYSDLSNEELREKHQQKIPFYLANNVQSDHSESTCKSNKSGEDDASGADDDCSSKPSWYKTVEKDVCYPYYNHVIPSDSTRRYRPSIRVFAPATVQCPISGRVFFNPPK